MCINWLWIRQRLMKGWGKKAIKYKKIIQSYQQSDSIKEKMLNDYIQKLLKAIMTRMIKQRNDEITK